MSFHLHIYLHKKLPFLNLSGVSECHLENKEVTKVIHKGSELLEFKDCPVCKNEAKFMFLYLKIKEETEIKKEDETHGVEVGG